MTAEIIEWVSHRKVWDQQHSADQALMSDPNYRFIHDLLEAMASAGLEIGGTPAAKAREAYARCQRENVFTRLAMGKPVTD